MADLTQAVAQSHSKDRHQTGASRRTRTISSGGKRRDDSLNPIIARVKRELIALATEHSNRVSKFNDNHDELGRFATGDGGAAYGADPSSSRTEVSQGTVENVRGKEVVRLSHEWPTSRPWEASAAAIVAGKVPGLVAHPWGQSSSILALAHLTSGSIWVNTDKWDERTPRERASVLYHELGHYAMAAADNDGAIQQRIIDASGQTPMDASSWGSHGDTIGVGNELAANLYAEAVTTAPRMDYELTYNETTHSTERREFPEVRQAAVRDLVFAEARYNGLPSSTQFVLFGPDAKYPIDDKYKIVKSVRAALKFNQNHDELGRFAESDGGGAATALKVAEDRIASLRKGEIVVAARRCHARLDIHKGNTMRYDLETPPPDYGKLVQAKLKEDAAKKSKEKKK